MIWLYNLVLLLTAPLWATLIFVKNLRRKDKVNWREKLGAYPLAPRKDRKRIWFHAVSVGETVAAKPIVARVHELLPEYEIVFTVGTGSGYRVAQEQLAGIVVAVLFFPLDIPRFCFSALRSVLPSVVVFLESEHWPNFLSMASQMGIRKLLVNGRVSDRTFRRSKTFGAILKLAVRNHDRCLMQTQEDANRIAALGGRNVEVFGNSKFDEALPKNTGLNERWRKELRIEESEFVLLIGSTRGDEEEQFVLSALANWRSQRGTLIWAPRHLERAAQICEKLEAAFGQASQRSKGETGKFLVLDTYGELAEVYAVADVVVVGGGFAPLGGQNILQPMAHGKPVIHGRHYFNFRDVADAAQACGATLIASDPEELRAQIERLEANPAERKERGDKAKILVEMNAGASERYAQAIVAQARSFQEELSRLSKPK